MNSWKTRWSRIVLTAVSVWLASGIASPAQSVLVEAEGFAKPGGWVCDPQFMDTMGSPYLLAHGLGQPVKDATTTVQIPTPGRYRVWVRTMDWVARWQAPGTPGRFQVLINGTPLQTVFGTKGAEWHWQDGGSVEIAGREITLALHDLTGFEGRCDAILLTTDAALAPPNRDPEMAAFRRKLLGFPEAPEASGQFDFIVVGGGMAGTCAAIAAARLGLKVALIQDRPVLGGNNSSEVRVWLQGARNKAPYPRVGDVVAELEPARRAHYGPANTADLYEDEKKLAVARAEPNLSLFLEHRVVAAACREGRIQSVIAHDIKTSRRREFVGRWFADCTGDAALGFLAGADWDMTPKGRMGPCNLWNVADTGAPAAFPRCPWALDLSQRPFPGRNNGKPDILQLGGWYWESGFDRDPFDEMEYVRDWNFRAMYGAWDALKNVDKALPNHRLNWCAHILGKRESRRLLGDVVLTLSDLTSGKPFPDGCVPTGWKVDLHLPDPRYEKGFEGNAFISRAEFGSYPMPFWIPYRCLYSRNVANLFMAGRDISVTHEALGAVRVMRTGGCMGEVVGMAASLCRQHDTTPRAIYERHLAELQALMRRGVGKNPGANPVYENQGEPAPKPATRTNPPEWLKRAGPNLARTAKLAVSGSKDAAQNPPARLNDGQADLARNEQRWLSDGKLPIWIEFAWDKPQTVNAARILSGYTTGGATTAPIAAFAWQYHDGQQWRDIPGASAKDNLQADWSARFRPVSSARLRLLITATQQSIARVWEVELYQVE